MWMLLSVVKLEYEQASKSGHAAGVVRVHTH